MIKIRDHQAFVVLDQLMQSFIQIILGYFCVRFLGIEEFGLFSIAMAVYYYIVNVYNGYLLDPLSIFSKSDSPDSKESAESAFKFTYYANLFLVVFCSIGALLGAVLENRIILLCSIVGLLSPFSLMQFSLKRINIIQGKSFLNFLFTLLYGLMILVVCLFLFLKKIDVVDLVALNSLSVFMSCVIPMYLVSKKNLIVYIKRSFYPSRHTFKPFSQGYRSYLKYSLSNAVISGFSSQAQVWSATAFLSASEVGNIRIYSMLLQPILQITNSLSIWNLPRLSLENSNSKKFRVYVNQSVLTSLVYGLVIFFLLKFISKAIGLEINEYNYIMYYFGAFISVVSLIQNTFMKSRLLTKELYYSGIVNPILSLLIYFVLVKTYGFNGLFIGILLSSLSSVIVNIIILKVRRCTW